MSRHESERHRKQREQREKNLRHWLIFMQSERMRIKVSVGAPLRQMKNPATETKKEAQLWSKQLVSIRNRLDNSRRVSDDRFNRFAGTDEGGGRGR